MSRIGQLITQHTQRDAIHVAIAPVQAGEWLKLGQRIKFNEFKQAIAADDSDYIGIVDPWLREEPQAGQWFWILMNPNTITALRHYWDHPDFPSMACNDELQAALEWMNQFSEDLGSNYMGYRLSLEELLQGADKWLQYGDYLPWGFDTDYITEEFWQHYQIIRNVTVPADKRANFFTCDC